MVFSRWTHTPPVSKKEEFRMKQTTLTQRLLSALVALCMVLSVCAPALAAEPEIGSAAMITLTKGGTTTDLKMPEGNVSLSAAYRETYHLYEDKSKAEFFVDGKQVYQAPAGVRVTVKLVDGFINDHHEFDQWQSYTTLVDPEEGWEHKPSFSFTMPSDIVLLVAHRTTLYDVNVTHGTIVDEPGETGASKKIVKPGQLVTVRAESTEENPFLQWTYTGKAPVEPDGGWPEGG